MGYELTLLIGKSKLRKKEILLDRSKPFSDGSGFDYQRDEKGNVVYTGREESWFDVYATIDMSKPGMCAITSLQHRTAKKANENDTREVFYFYGQDGNTQYTEDRYGDMLRPVPIQEALEAMTATVKSNTEYRRFKWALALLQSMADDSEQLEVMFWGALI